MADAPLALITGSSTGIGLEIARELGRRGHDLVLCADEPHDRTLFAGATVVSEVQTDLATPQGVDALLETVRATGRPVALAAINAGRGVGGLFLDSPVDEQLQVVGLNVASTVRLAHGLLGDMVRLGQGRVLVTSSVVSGMPGPQQATYNASKAFVQSFGEALQLELAGTGVSLTLLRPGATESPFWDRAGLRTSLLGRMPKDDPAATARLGVEAALAGRASAVPATPTGRLLDLTTAVVPSRVKKAMQSVLSKPR